MELNVITPEMIITFALTFVVIVLFIGEWLSMEGISILIFVTLAVTNVLPGSSFLSGFSSPAPWMVASLFVVGAGFLHTGLVHSLGLRILRWSGYSARKFLLILMTIVMVISAFINNTAVVAVFMPLTILWARQLNIAPSKLLMPLSFCAILGGTCTLIGTSTNVVISSFSEVLNFEPIGMFEMSGMGIIFALAGMAYMYVISIYFMPDRMPPLDKTSCPLIRKKYVTEFQITEKSPFVGKKINETALGESQDNYKIFNIVREEEAISPPFNNHTMKAHDVLLIEVPIDHIKLLQEKYMLSLKADHHLRPRDKGAEQVQLAEVMIPPGSKLINKTLSKLKFRLTHHVVVLAIQRRAKVLVNGFSSVPLSSGDILLLSGSTTAIDRMGNSKHLTLLSSKLEEEHKIRHKKGWVALAILAGFVLLSSLTNIPIVAISLLAAATMVGFGCLSLEQAYQSISWKIILFLGSAISLGDALTKTGAANFLAQYGVSILQPYGERGIIMGIYIVTVFISSFITNNAAAAIMLPFVYGISTQMGMDSSAFIMTVLFAASAAFATPIGYQTNMFIYGAGGYRFRDFLLVGIPLNIILGIISVFLIPHFWPLYVK